MKPRQRSEIAAVQQNRAAQQDPAPECSPKGCVSVAVGRSRLRRDPRKAAGHQRTL